MVSGISIGVILMVKEKKIKYSKSKQEAYRKLNDLVIGYIVDTHGFISQQTGYVLQKNQYLDFYLRCYKDNNDIHINVSYSGMTVGAINVQNGVWSYSPFSTSSSSRSYRLEPSLVKKLKSVLKSLLNYTMRDDEAVLSVYISYYDLHYYKTDKWGHNLELGVSPYINLN